MMKRLAKYRKLIAALGAALGEALALGLLPAPADKWGAVVLAALGAYGVYKVTNAKDEGDEPGTG